MLFENGRGREALPSYEQSVKLLPDSALLRTALGQAMIETGDPARLQPAIAHLEEAVRLDHQSPFTWRQLAIAYGRKGELGLAALALAEQALIVGDTREARLQSQRAQKQLPVGSPGHIRALDIERSAERE